MSQKGTEGSNLAYEIIEPNAASLTESLRSFGYDLGSAIADVIDNSISAGAKHVWLSLEWNELNSRISITDDGRGMSEDSLRQAMRLGSRNPSEERETDDLGRFGLGLKTASFSQCRSVTVCSKIRESNATTRRWDLDHLSKVNQWQVLTNSRNGSENAFDQLGELPSGTTVLWEILDRVQGITESDFEKGSKLFFEQCELVEKHLCLVFHRLLESEKDLTLFINGRRAIPVDPFFPSIATQELQKSRYSDPSGGEILVEPFVMPHESKLPDERTKMAAGDPRDWTSRQGFYVYRHGRLLLSASWLGFRGWRKDDYHKLARIRINITNSSDADWQIDVTKRKANPPPYLKEKLRKIGEITRERAKKVYTYRGNRLVANSPQERKFVWNQINIHGKSSFQINREHPLISSIRDTGDSHSKSVEALLKLIEGSIPMLLIAASNTEEVTLCSHQNENSEEEETREMLRQSWHALRDNDFGHHAAVEMLAAWEPFDAYPQLIAELNTNPPYP